METETILDKFKQAQFKRCCDVPMGTVPTDQPWQSMMFSAFMYALGRRTYIVNSTCEYIVQNIKYFDQHWLHLFRQRLKGFIDEHYRHPEHALADDCDMEDWQALYNAVVARLQELGETL